VLLALSIGNSQVAVGLADATGWRARWHLKTSDRRTADEYGVFVVELLEQGGFARADVRHVAIASVVPALTPVMARMATDAFDRPALVVGPGTRTGLAIRYNSPASLGTDRVLDAVAARARCGAPVVVVDFGTATTFNVVDGAGRFIGGAIAPGVGVAAEALVSAGAMLRAVDLGPGSSVPFVGRTTEESVRAGVVHGYAGLVRGLLARTAGELAHDGVTAAPVVATGGMAPVVAPLVPAIRQVIPDLALEGLRLVHALNEEAHD
jgi:type III pantothenate kinase